jgi:hypothetical protein
LLRTLHFLLDKCRKIRIISHQVNEAEKLVEFGGASTLIEMSGGWVHSVLRAGACHSIFRPGRVEQILSIYLAHPNDRPGSRIARK